MKVRHIELIRVQFAGRKATPVPLPASDAARRASSWSRTVTNLGTVELCVSEMADAGVAARAMDQ